MCAHVDRMAGKVTKKAPIELKAQPKGDKENEHIIPKKANMFI